MSGFLPAHPSSEPLLPAVRESPDSKQKTKHSGITSTTHSILSLTSSVFSSRFRCSVCCDVSDDWFLVTFNSCSRCSHRDVDCSALRRCALSSSSSRLHLIFHLQFKHVNTSDVNLVGRIKTSKNEVSIVWRNSLADRVLSLGFQVLVALFGRLQLLLRVAQ